MLWFVCSQRLAVWLVADFEVISYQGTMNFDKMENLKTGTVTAINYTACCAKYFFNHFNLKNCKLQLTKIFSLLLITS